jgi:hypothetical protein
MTGDASTNGKTESRSEWVYVVGGGIAGLTAAHELVERGFKVSVIEKLARPFDANDCEVGGLARTQWSSSPIYGGDPIAGAPAFRAPSLMRSDPRLGEILVHEIRFRRGSFELSDENIDVIRSMTKDLSRVRNAWYESISPYTPILQILVQGYALDDEAPVTSPTPEEMYRFLRDPRFGTPFPGLTVDDVSKRLLLTGDTPAQRLSRCRAWLVYMVMVANFTDPEVMMTFLPVPVAMGGVPRSFPDEPMQDAVVRLQPRDALIPGEHGYRYFPAFYRHVMDTMKRIPVFESAVPPRPRQVREVLEIAALTRGLGSSQPDPDRDVAPLIMASNLAESPRTVFDNLVPTYQFAIATGDGLPPIPVPRVEPRSFAAIKRLISTAFTRLGVGPIDTLRFQLKLLVFMTSCSTRRRNYEGMTWWEFIGADRYGERFQKLVERWPQALVGLRARLADARTIGTVTVQLLLDQVSATTYRDGTLNGPTTRAWFDPWRRYLEARGVEFFRGDLAGISLKRIVPEATTYLHFDWNGKAPALDKMSFFDGYVVLAVPPMEAQRIVITLYDSCDAKQKEAFPRSFRPLLRWPLPTPGAHGGLRIERDAPSGTLRHYSGIQFYLAADLGPAQGHMYFAGSEWSLSAISQIQFWQQRLVNGEGTIFEKLANRYVSILSVDVGDWHAPATRLKRCAAECSRQELAEEVWRQVEDGLAHDGWKPPKPFSYHVDDDVLYEVRGADAKGRPFELPVENLSPYPVNLAGDWDNHPGSEEGDAYEIFEGVVLAGSYAKTRTRLTTMESANESARRAVNAILNDYNGTDAYVRVPDHCQLWDPEDYEVDDLEILERIDAELMAQGLPHMFEILDVEKIVELGASSPAAIVDALRASSGMSAATFAAEELSIRLLQTVLQALLD